MEGPTVLILLAIVGLWLYRAGKSDGSRKGYGVGFRRGRRHRRRS